MAHTIRATGADPSNSISRTPAQKPTVGPRRRALRVSERILRA